MAKLTKLELRKSRLKILAEIDRLDKDRCELCIPDNGFSETEKSHCTCDSAIKIRALGEKLNKLVSARKTPESKVIAVPDVTGITLKNFTVELYEKMKLARLTDHEVRRLIGAGGNQFWKWKNENGVSKKSKGVGRN